MLKLALRNVSRRKIRSLAIIFSIALSVALFVALDLSSRVALIATSKAYTSYIGDFDILVYKDGLAVFSYSNVTHNLSEISGIHVIAPRLFFGAKIRTFISLPIVVVGLNLSMEEDMGKIDILEGKNSLGFNECFVLESLASSLSIKAGDYINISIGKEETIYSLKVTAIINQSGKLPMDITSAIFVNLSSAWRMLNSTDIINMVFVKISDSLVDPENPDYTVHNILSVAEKIQVSLGFDFVVEPVKAGILDQVREGLLFQKVFLGAFSTITLIMSMLLVLMISLMNYYDRLREVGILRAIGASRKRIFFTYLAENLLLGIIGGLLGSLMGFLFFERMRTMLIPKALQKYVSFYVFPIDTLSSGFLLGILIVVAGGIYPAIKAVLLKPIEAIQPAARRIKYLETIEKKISPEAVDSRMIFLGVGVFLTILSFIILIPALAFMDNVAFLFMLLFGVVLIVVLTIILMFVGLFPKIIQAIISGVQVFSGLIAHIVKGNVLRHKQRYIAIFLMLSLAVASLFTVSFLISTQMKTMEYSMKMSSGSPVVVYARQPLPENITQIISEVENIRSYCLVTYYYWIKVGDIINWKTLWVRIQGINESTYYSSSYAREFGIKESVLLKLKENFSVIISSGIASYLGVSVGDKIRFNFGNKVIALKVVAVLDKFPGFSFSAYSTKASGNDIIVSIGTFREIFSLVTYSKIFVYPISVFHMNQVVNDLQKKLGKEYDVQVISIQDLIDRSKEALEDLEAILSSILFLAIIVSILGQFLGILTAIRERLWEIGVMRAIGVSRSKLAIMFMLEAIVVSISSYVVGFLSALTITLEMTYITNSLSEIPLIIVIPSDIVINIFAITILPIAISSFGLAYFYSRKNIAQILTKAEKF